MRAIGIDFGEKRIGLAVSDDGGRLATPYGTVKRVGDRSVEHREIIQAVVETGAGVIVVGMPYQLTGEVGHAASSIGSEIRGLSRRFAAAGLDLVIETQDERFTTVTASQSLAAGGLDSRKQRKVIDSVAAAVLLQAWLDRDR